MRNIAVCNYDCICFCVHFPKDSEGKAMYQCTRDIDADGFSQGPYPFDKVASMPLPSNCGRALHHAVLGDGSVLDAADANLHYDITADNVHRFLSLCTNCRCFRHELHPPSGEQIMFCDKDAGLHVVHDSEMQQEQQMYEYGNAHAYLTRPLPAGCLLSEEQQALKDSLAKTTA